MIISPESFRYIDKVKQPNEKLIIELICYNEMAFLALRVGMRDFSSSGIPNNFNYLYCQLDI